MLNKREIKRRASQIALLAMDVDGVLTPGEIIIMESGEEVKIWNVKDRLGFYLARLAGLKLAWISARSCRQVEEMAKELKLEGLYMDHKNKLAAFQDLMNRYNLGEHQIAYIGDDLVDIPVLKSAGLSICPSDAVEEVKRIVHFVIKTSGGTGCLREVVELILQSQGKWSDILKKYYQYAG